MYTGTIRVNTPNRIACKAPMDQLRLGKLSMRSRGQRATLEGTIGVLELRILRLHSNWCRVLQPLLLKLVLFLRHSGHTLALLVRFHE